jgi:CRISPR-associated endonuclease/helicase Cas3
LVRIPAETEGEQDAAWEYFVARPTVSSGSTTELLDLHQGRVARAASEVARRSGLDERTVAVFEWAANWHDAGKARDLWQRAAGNDKTNPPVAKTERLNPRVLDGFRHELGSLIDCQAGLPEYFTAEERDLALYLIGAHHGWGRPHFPERAFDKENYRESERLALESARRFGRLQRRYGAWHLAYIESLFRSADAIVSSSETEFANA